MEDLIWDSRFSVNMKTLMDFVRQPEYAQINLFEMIPSLEELNRPPSRA